MPELPEVEVLVRHLSRVLPGKTVKAVMVRRDRVLAPTPPMRLKRALVGCRFLAVTRRGKCLLFTLHGVRPTRTVNLLGHLGMTGRMYLQPLNAPLPKHAAVVLNLGRTNLIFEDTRYFGRMTLDLTALGALGPEPLGNEFTTDGFARALSRSAQPIKVKLLDQSVVAGIGNIYASEALFVAGISPRRASRRLARPQVKRLHRAIRAVLQEAIRFGSTVPLNWAGVGANEGLFYYGRAGNTSGYYEERLRVYDREGRPCPRCRARIRRIEQAGRSSYYCPRCQRS